MIIVKALPFYMIRKIQLTAPAASLPFIYDANDIIKANGYKKIDSCEIQNEQQELGYWNTGDNYFEKDGCLYRFVDWSSCDDSTKGDVVTIEEIAGIEYDVVPPEISVMDVLYGPTEDNIKPTLIRHGDILEVIHAPTDMHEP